MINNYQPLLSIIVTSYNDEKYILECIESIVCQKRSDVEIIFIDDCSIDNSIIIANRYKGYMNIIALKSNGGLSNARNIGLKQANGKYVMFVDGDDYLKNDCIQVITKIIETNEYDIVAGLMEVFKETPDVAGRWNDPILESDSLINDYPDGEKLMKLLEYKLKISPAQKYIVRRQFIIENDLFFKNCLHEDHLWTPKSLALANNIYFLNQKFYYHRIRRGSLGDRFDIEVCSTYLDICDELLDFEEEIDDYNKKCFIEQRCAYLLTKISKNIHLFIEDDKNSFLAKNSQRVKILLRRLNLEESLFVDMI